MEYAFLQPYYQRKTHYGGENGYVKTRIVDFSGEGVGVGNSHICGGKIYYIAVVPVGKKS